MLYRHEISRATMTLNIPIWKSTSSLVAVESSMGVVHSRPTCDNQDDQWHAAASRDLQLAGESPSTKIPPASNNDSQTSGVRNTTICHYEFLSYTVTITIG